MKRAIVLAGAAALLAGAPAAGQGTEPEPAPARCQVRVADADLTEWREVRADGFTFCVPPEWRPRGRARNGKDAREWRGDGGTVTWGTGQARPVVGSAMVRVPAGERLPPIPPPEKLYRQPEMIGGAEAQVWDAAAAGQHDTGAAWERPAIYLQGRADSDESAREQLIVYRTVRFTQPPR